MAAIAEVSREDASKPFDVSKLDSRISFIFCRVPFFLEPEYNLLPSDFWEPHDTRMIRKFGSREAFERIKLSHDLGLF